VTKLDDDGQQKYCSIAISPDGVVHPNPK